MGDERRGQLFGAALGFLALEPRAPELQLLHRWADTWRGVGDVVVGMERQGYRLHLTNIEAGTGRRGVRGAEINVCGKGPHAWQFGDRAPRPRPPHRIPGADAKAAYL